MEFFNEKNGKYFAESISGNPTTRTAVRMGMVLIGAGVFAYVLFLSPMKDQIQDRTPLLIGMGVFLFVNLISVFLRSAGLGSGVVVDQMNSTVSYRKPGGNRQSVPLSSLKSIIITVVPMKASILSLEKAQGGRHIVMYSSDPMKMRMFADELSTLTSLTVNEEVNEQKKDNA